MLTVVDFAASVRVYSRGPKGMALVALATLVWVGLVSRRRVKLSSAAAQAVGPCRAQGWGEGRAKILVGSPGRVPCTCVCPFQQLMGGGEGVQAGLFPYRPAPPSRRKHIAACVVDASVRIAPHVCV
jgi:hypothetical protein